MGGQIGAVPVGDVLTSEKDCSCERCGKYKKLNKSEESSLVEYVEGVYKDIYERSKYVSQCDCNGKKIITAEPTRKLYPRTNIGTSLWLRLIVQKFCQACYSRSFIMSSTSTEQSASAVNQRQLLLVLSVVHMP